METKSTLLSAVFMSILPCVAENALAQCTPDITSDLIARWDFSGNAVDLSGHGHDGTLVGPVISIDRCSNPDAALIFNGNGTGQYVSVPHAAELTLTSTDYSISVWIKSDTLTSNGVILSKRNGTGLSNGYIFFITNDEKVGFAVAGGSPGSFNLRSSAVVDTTKWHHLVLSYSATTDTMLLYIDNRMDTAVAAVPSPAATGSQLRIGNDSYGQTYEFNGRIDDIRMYDRALSACDVDSLFRTLCDLTASVTGKEPEYFAVHVFPNPSSGTFTIGLPLQEDGEGIEVLIHNCVGKLVDIRSLAATSRTVTTSLAPGVYSLRIKIDAHVYSARLIVEVP